MRDNKDFDESFTNKNSVKTPKHENTNIILLKIYNDYTKKKINLKNINSYRGRYLKALKDGINNDENIVRELDAFFKELEMSKKIDSVFTQLNNKITENEEKIVNLISINEKELNKKTGNIKAEILTMMGLFFALFTFIQINLTFTLQFIEKYSGYRVILFICIINMILLLMLSFIMEIIGAIVYGENLARIRDGDKKYWKFFPESKLKIKRTFVFSIIFLLIIAVFSFYKENDKEILKYEVLQKEFENYKKIDTNIDKVIEDKLKNKKIGKLNEVELENLKKEIKLEILQNRENKEN